MQAVLSTDILASIRHHVSVALGGAKSSHIAEALAAALGHRTNASLLSWLRAQPLSQAAVLPFDPDAATARLATLGYERPASAAFADAARSAGAVVAGRPYPETGSEAVRIAGHKGWSALTNVQRFAYMAFLMNWRMDHSSIGVMDFVENYADPLGHKLHLRLAACLHERRDHDREMADFLSEFLLQAWTVERCGDAQARMRYGDYVYWGFQPRIVALFDAVCRTWDPEIDPWAISPARAAAAGSRPARSAALVGGRGAKEGEVGLGDTGAEPLAIEAVVGACCFALLKSGVDKGMIGEFGDEAFRSARDVLDVCRRHVPFGEGLGTSAALAAVQRSLFPQDVKAAAVGVGFDVEDASLIVVDSRADAARILAVMRQRARNVFNYDRLPGSGAPEQEVDGFLGEVRSALRFEGPTVLALHAGGRSVNPRVTEAFRAAAVHGFTVVASGLVHETQMALTSGLEDETEGSVVEWKSGKEGA